MKHRKRAFASGGPPILPGGPCRDRPDVDGGLSASRPDVSCAAIFSLARRSPWLIRERFRPPSSFFSLLGVLDGNREEQEGRHGSHLCPERLPPQHCQRREALQAPGALFNTITLVRNAPPCPAGGGEISPWRGRAPPGPRGCPGSALMGGCRCFLPNSPTPDDYGRIPRLGRGNRPAPRADWALRGPVRGPLGSVDRVPRQTPPL